MNERDEKPAEAPPGTEIRYQRSSVLPGIMLVTSCFRGDRPPSTIDRRWLFARTDAGDGDVLVGKTEVQLTTGTLIALEPGDCVTPLRRRSESTSHRTLLADPEPVARFFDGAFPDGKARLRRGLLGEAAVRAFDALWEAVVANEPSIEQEGLWAAFLETACEDVGAPMVTTVMTPPVARAKKYIEERFNEDVRLEHLEAEVGLSRFYLVRRFRAEVGMPPHAYQLAMRLDRAKTLVVSGMALADVAARCGFTDQSHLTRHFRRAVGVAPGAYARSAGVRR